MQPWNPCAMGLSLALDARELRTLRLKVLVIQEQGSQLEGLDEADLSWWNEVALCCFTENRSIEHWGLGGDEAESLWLYWPLLREINDGSSTKPTIQRPPGPEQLASLLADSEVLVLRVLPVRGAAHSQAKRRPCLPAGCGGAMEASTASWPGLRCRLAIGCRVLGDHHEFAIATVAKDTGAEGHAA